eukprot:tig00000180_g13615.t1
MMSTELAKQPPNAQLLSTYLNSIANVVGEDLTVLGEPLSSPQWDELNAAARRHSASDPSIRPFEKHEQQLIACIGHAMALGAKGYVDGSAPGTRIQRVASDPEYTTAAALQPPELAAMQLDHDSTASVPVHRPDGPSRKHVGGLPAARSTALHATSAAQQAHLRFPAPAPDELVGYGPDRPTDFAEPESADSDPDSSQLPAPVPIGRVIDGINGLPHDFRRLLLQCHGYVYALGPDGTLGDWIRVKFIFDTGAMGEVAERRMMPKGTRYTGTKTLRAFMHHATIEAEIAHVVLRFGDVYVSRAVHVVPDGTLGPDADMLIGIGTIMCIDGRIDTTRSGWCLHARDAHYKPHVIPFRFPGKHKGLCLSGSSALSKSNGTGANAGSAAS